ncbi:response regulator [Roseibium sp.]|uniref:response regulator n=1 Tax=Roseibium sp. TaxID=1936156 RepID=UPI003A977838
MRLHIIEDDLAVSDALALVLGELGYEVICYPDAESFLDAPLPSSDETVIVDLGLPGVGGDEIVRMLKARTVPPRVIVISGRSQTSIRHTIADMPALTVLRKPLSLPALTEHLS